MVQFSQERNMNGIKLVDKARRIAALKRSCHVVWEKQEECAVRILQEGVRPYPVQAPVYQTESSSEKRFV